MKSQLIQMSAQAVGDIKSKIDCHVLVDIRHLPK